MYRSLNSSLDALPSYGERATMSLLNVDFAMEYPASADAAVVPADAAPMIGLSD